MKLRRKFGFVLAVAAVASPIAVTGVRAGTSIEGTGATFPANLIDICTSSYQKNSLSNPDGDTMAYVTPQGSGAGKTAFSNQTKSWAATDSVYTSNAPTFGFVYVPIISGAISVMYHLDGVTPAGSNVRLSPLTVGKIFAGEIKMWNDPAIQADNKSTVIPAVKKVSKGGVVVTVAKSGTKLNFAFTSSAAGLSKFKGKPVTVAKVITKGTTVTRTQVASKAIAAKGTLTAAYVKGATYAVKVGGTSLGSLGVDSTTSGVTLTLPSTLIRVAYRSGTSGTTNNFTNFLNKSVGSVWTKAANDSFSLAFPTSVPSDGTFQAVSGSDGVANYVKANNGAITYTELSYAEDIDRKSATVQSAAIKNNAGVYVLPSAAATGAFYAEAAVSADGVVTPDYTVAASDAYLINAVSYGLGATAASPTNTKVSAWFTYILNKCAPASGPGAFYAPLAGSIKTKALAQAAKVGAS